jgi:lysyl-tRNA synthetase class 1
LVAAGTPPEVGASSIRPTANAETLQTIVYEVGKRHACFPDLKAWFRALYEVLLGQSEGPRMGSFIALYGVAETVALIGAAIAGSLSHREKARAGGG